MNTDQLIERLTEIQKEYCPTPPDKALENMEAGDYWSAGCGCAICSLIGDLIIEQVRERQDSDDHPNPP